MTDGMSEIARASRYADCLDCGKEIGRTGSLRVDTGKGYSDVYACADEEACEQRRIEKKRPLLSKEHRMTNATCVECGKALEHEGKFTSEGWICYSTKACQVKARTLPLRPRTKTELEKVKAELAKTKEELEASKAEVAKLHEQISGMFARMGK